MNERSEGIDEARNCRKSFDELNGALTGSHEMYPYAERYHTEDGNLNMPAEYIVDGIWAEKASERTKANIQRKP